MTKVDMYRAARAAKNGIFVILMPTGPCVRERGSIWSKNRCQHKDSMAMDGSELVVLIIVSKYISSYFCFLTSAQGTCLGKSRNLLQVIFHFFVQLFLPINIWRPSGALSTFYQNQPNQIKILHLKVKRNRPTISTWIIVSDRSMRQAKSRESM